MISIVIPTYNGIRHLKTCFDSLMIQSFKDFGIILVDNGSNDGTIEFTDKEYPMVEVIKLDTNTGFAHAVNEGIRHSLKDRNITHILLLNNDIECSQDFLEEMLKGFINDETGSVACKMMNYYERNKFDDTGDFIKFKGSPYARGHAEIDTGQYDTPEFIFGACAGAALYKREVFESIGFFDEDFFAYYEDIDISLRSQLSGFKCYYNPRAVCYHKRGATSPYHSGWQTKQCEKNLIALRIKNYPASIYLMLSPFFLVGRIKRFLGFIRHQPLRIFQSAVTGYFLGLLQIPKSLKKRKQIQKLKKVNNKYFRKLFI